MKRFVWLGVLLSGAAWAGGGGSPAQHPNPPQVFNGIRQTLEVSACSAKRCSPWKTLRAGEAMVLPWPHPTALSISERANQATDLLLVGVRPGVRLDLTRSGAGKLDIMISSVNP